ncbi:MAG: Putative large exoprotein involved in heme utilization or adhesion of ShlA/HecA/FhaA family [uncultured Campylobacterales bacterium]|uniref:Large exoprotein involved in heme utilization or adhesion of ShlA/HecA/FhaA family n=1 Tax=uncultured Campylobacterales bacterium TaxID=352960 RepID=A0A6S6SCS0_9BACT|nr:MAG: Putative large exoprotein involved in heme utilization or adhesion of ShlA/HecA/FhaA family [uncultured Campylobacterales bacterium]
MKTFARQILSTYVSIGLTFSPLLGAGLQVDLSNNRGNTNLTNSVNGIDIVNIARPNNGISHNRFKDYNVKEQGLILNNSKDIVGTNIGGVINANTNLINGSANLIINEVTSTHKSNIDGITEVAGQSADVIVANPNGINVKNAGFINTPKATLTTAKPIIRNGELSEFNLKNGEIVIEKSDEYGLASSGEVELISKNIKINSPIMADSINIKAGTNEKEIVLDSTELGGMYANKIKIHTSSDTNLRGNIISGDDGFSIDSTGMVVISNTKSSGNIDIVADQNKISQAVSGNELNIYSTNGNTEISELYSKSGTNIVSNGITKINEAIVSGDSINILSDEVINDGSIVTLDDGTQNDIIINSSSITNNNLVESDGSVVLNSTEYVANSGVVVSKNNDISINSKNINNQGVVLAKENISLLGSDILINNNANVVAKNVSLVSELNINNKSNISADENLKIISKNNLNKSSTLSAKSLTIDADELQNDSSIVYADEISLSSQNQKNINSKIQANKNLSIVSSKTLENTNSDISAQNVAVLSSSVINQDSSILAKESVAVLADEVVNDESSIYATNSLSQTSKKISNLKTTTTAKDINIKSDEITNVLSNTLATNELNLKTKTLKNNSSSLLGDSTQIESSSIDNIQGTIASNKNLNIKSNSLDNTKGLIKADNININSAYIKNNTEGIITAKNIDITSNNLQNINSSSISANENLKIASSLIENKTNSNLSAGGKLDFKSSTIINDNANILVNGDIKINSSTLNNQNNAKIQSGQNLDINTYNLNNKNALISTEKNAIINVGNYLLNYLQGKIISGQNLNIKARNVNNQQGTISSGKDLDLYSYYNLYNQGGSITANGDIKLNLRYTLSNQNGFIQSANNIFLKSNQVINQSGKIQSGEDTSIDSSILYNYWGEILSGNNISINSPYLYGNSSKITAFGNININANNYLNLYRTNLLSNQKISLKSNYIQSAYSKIKSNILEVDTKTLNNYRGNYETFGLFDLTSPYIQYLGFINSHGNTKLTTNNLTVNNNNQIKIGKNLILNIAGILSNLSNIVAGNDISITVNDVVNQGTISSGKDLVIYVKSSLQNLYFKSLIKAKDNILIAAGPNGVKTNYLKNHDGTIEADSVYIDTKNFQNMYGADIKANNDIVINSSYFNNYYSSLNANNIFITSDNISNGFRGYIAATDTAYLKSKNNLYNRGGTITADKLSLLSDATVYSYGSINARSDITLKTTKLSNHMNLLKNKNNVSLTLTNDNFTINRYNSFDVDENLYLDISGNIINQYDGLLRAKENINLKASNLSNYGEISAGNNLKLNISNILLNQNANIGAVNNLSILGSDDTKAVREIKNIDSMIQTTNGYVNLQTDKLSNLSTTLPTHKTIDKSYLRNKTIDITKDINLLSSVKNEMLQKNLNIKTYTNVLRDSKGYYYNTTQKVRYIQRYAIQRTYGNGYIKGYTKWFYNNRTYYYKDRTVPIYAYKDQAVKKYINPNEIVNTKVSIVQTGSRTYPIYTSWGVYYRTVPTYGYTTTIKTINQNDIYTHALNKKEQELSKDYKVTKSGNTLIATAMTRVDMMKNNYDSVFEGKAKISSGSDLYITQKNHNGYSPSLVNNYASIDAKGDVLINMQRSISNIAGQISGQNVSVISKYGYLSNVSILKNLTLKAYDGTASSQYLSTANINATGNLHLGARYNISLNGADLNAGGQISMKSDYGNIDLDTIKTSGYTGYSTNNHQATRYKTSDISAGSNIVLSARNITTYASDIKAKDQILLNATYNINTNALNDVDSRYYYTSWKHGSWYKRKRTTIESAVRKESVKSTNLEAGKITLLANNINLDATIARSNTDSIIAKSKNNIHIKPHEFIDESKYSRQTTKRFLGAKYGSSSNLSAFRKQLFQSSDLVSANDISLISGNDIKIVGSKLNAANNINLTAKNNLTIKNAVETAKSEEETSNSGFGVGGNLYAKLKELKGKITQNIKSSTLQAGNKVNMNAGSVDIIGSNILGANGINIVSTSGDINILDAVAKNQEYRKKEEVKLSVGDAVKGITDLKEQVKIKNGKKTFSLGEATYEKLDSNLQYDKVTSSVLKTLGGDIVLNSANDLTIKGSHLDTLQKDADDLLLSSGDIIAKAKNIAILEAKETSSNNKDHLSGKAELKFTIQHQAVEVVRAAEALKQAKDALSQVKDSYKKYKDNIKKYEDQLISLKGQLKAGVPGVTSQDISELSDYIKEAKSDEAWYIASISAAALNLTSKTTQLAQQTAAAAQSSSTYGFNAGLQLDIDATKAESTNIATKSINSSMKARNITLLSDDNTKIVGASLIAEKGLNLHSSTLDLLASQDTTNSKNSSKNAHITISATVHGGANTNLNASLNTSSDRSYTLNNTNTKLNANNINISTKGDLNIKGANLHSKDSSTIDIGGDLNFASVQNISSSKSKSSGISAGTSQNANGDTSGVNAGLNLSNTKAYTKQTLKASITSNGALELNVAGNTALIGATIASIDEDGKDTGKLTFSTGSFEFMDLSDIERSSGMNFGLSANVGVDPNNPNGGTKDNSLDITHGSETLNYQNNSAYKKSKTLATIGKGLFSVGGKNYTDTTLNRDTDNIQKNLFDLTRTQGDIDLVIDNRLFSTEGRSEIKEDFKRTKILADSLADIIEDSVSLLSNQANGETSILEHIETKQNFFTATKNFVNDPENKVNMETLQNGNASAEQKQQAYSALVGYISQEMGVTSTQAKLILADNIKGGVFSQDNQNIYLVDNDIKNLGTSAGAVEVLGHEVSHYLDFTKDKNIDKTSEYKDNRDNYAHLMGDATLDYTNFNYTANGYNALHTVINRQNYENQNRVDSLLNQNALEFNSLDRDNMDGFIGKIGSGIAISFLGMLEAPKDQIPDISDTLRFTEFALNVLPMGIIGGKLYISINGKIQAVSEKVYNAINKIRIDVDPNVLSSGGFGGIKIGIKNVDNLVDELIKKGVKVSPDKVLDAVKVDGKIIFLEKGNKASGFEHIWSEHGKEFLNKGFSKSEIPSLIMKTVSKGKIIGYQGRGTGRPIYEVLHNGNKYNVAITIGDNGYIVGANLRSIF